ncbi:hypothetical protein [Salinibacter grassmerensis]|uniref:hypothetical protein n=1 Tax=Salinibacter grassmerensis TaxID=3040353 RepID=UPI0021E97FB9|nr:hypothetical protein [Salinibacter grassmerensis]
MWTPPSRPDSVLRQLDRIDRSGATAVRLTRLPSAPIAARADSLGLRLYVDLPVEAVSASWSDGARPRADASLDRLLSLANRHASITHVGLARGVNTTAPRTCDRLRRWADRIRDQSPSLQTYYVTPFIPSADQCAGAVDHPLLDLRGHPRPTDRWHAWRAQTASVGIGALGTWTRPDAPAGLRVPHSAERQARYLETTLSRLLDSTRAAPPVVFVARWQDDHASLLPARRYGLHDAAGTPRPAAKVVRGIYSGTQRTFAFPDGSAPTGTYGLVLGGWGLVAVLGLLYAGSLFVRETAVRYFTAPGFYRDALQDGREVSSGANGLLLSLVGGSLGVAAARTAQLAAAQPETERVLAALPRIVGTALAPGIEHPVLAGLAVGGGALALLLLWMGALVATARLGTRFTVAQGLMLVTWPCWPVLLASPIALAAGPHAPLSPSLFGLVLLGGGTLALISVTLRVLFDYWQVTDAPAWTSFPLVALSPLALVGTSLLVAGQYGVSFSLLWRLAVYT